MATELYLPVSPRYCTIQNNVLSLIFMTFRANCCHNILIMFRKSDVYVDEEPMNRKKKKAMSLVVQMEVLIEWDRGINIAAVVLQYGVNKLTV